MNKNILIGVGVVVIIIIVGMMYYPSGSTDGVAMSTIEQEKSIMTADENKQVVAPEKIDTDGAVMAKTGSYEAYAAEKIALASEVHDVVLFFNAAWCPTCRAIDADIKAHASSIPATLTVLSVNYDDSTALKRKYGVTYQHTFVQVDKDGNMIKKWTGSPTLTALVAEVK